MVKRILIVLDRRPWAHAALHEGLRLARLHDAEATLLALQARLPIATTDSIPPIPVASDEFERAAKADADRLLAAAHQAAARAGVMSRGLIGRGEDPAAQIVEVARRRRAELIVVPCEDLNALLRLLTGSLVPALITASLVPLLVCKPTRDDPEAARGTRAVDVVGEAGQGREAGEPAGVCAAPQPDSAPRGGRVLVVLEPRPGAAQAAISEGLRAAQVERAELVFVPTANQPRAPEAGVESLRGRALAAAERAGVAARCDDLGPTPSPHELATHAQDLGCQLVVVACEGRNAVTRLLAGSLAPRLITAAGMPVLVCRDREPCAACGCSGARPARRVSQPRDPLRNVASSWSSSTKTPAAA